MNKIGLYAVRFKRVENGQAFLINNDDSDKVIKDVDHVDNVKLWYQRLGHLNFESLKKMGKWNLLNNFDLKRKI